MSLTPEKAEIIGALYGDKSLFSIYQGLPFFGFLLHREQSISPSALGFGQKLVLAYKKLKWTHRLKMTNDASKEENKR